MTKKVYIITGIGVVVGLLAGYLYYQEIGCLSGIAQCRWREYFPDRYPGHAAQRRQPDPGCRR